MLLNALASTLWSQPQLHLLGGCNAQFLRKTDRVELELQHVFCGFGVGGEQVHIRMNVQGDSGLGCAEHCQTSKGDILDLFQRKPN